MYVDDNTDTVWLQALCRIIEVLDPESDGKIHFTQFCEGVKQIMELQGTCDSLIQYWYFECIGVCLWMLTRLFVKLFKRLFAF